MGLPDPKWQTGGCQLGVMLTHGQVRGAEQLKRAELLQTGLWRTEEHWTDAACDKKHCKVASARLRLSNAAMYCMKATNFDIRWC